MIITSFANPRIKNIRKLDHKKYRQETGLFFIEGLRTVGEAVQTRASIETLLIAPDLLVSEFGKSLLATPWVKDIEVLEVSSEIYEKIAHKEGPQGIGAVVRQSWHSLSELNIGHTDLWVALDAVADPGNLGTIMRTAEAVGARGIILIGHTTDPYDPTAVKASMGALFSLTLAQASWDDFRQWQKANQLMMVGASDHAQTDYQEIDYKRPLVLLMGSERHGLSADMESECNQMARIPMEGRSDSLNLAVATALMLYEIYNQTRKLVTINL